MEETAFVKNENDSAAYLADYNSSPNAEFDSNKVISVIGSGDYGRAISASLVRCGYTVFIGSRYPNRSYIQKIVWRTGANLVSQDTAIGASNIIIICVTKNNYDSLPKSKLNNKILIDVSNNTKKRKGPELKSNAEYLQSIIPDSDVVKGFNVLSAYSLENVGQQGSKEVYVASDSSNAKNTVANVIRSMGYTSVDWGSLKAARDIENMSLRLMPSWHKPMIFSGIIFAFIFGITILGAQICPMVKSGNWTKKWKNISLINMNRATGSSALWLLALCYLPGLFAAYIQLYRGTKYSIFPNWLDQWLKMRKQLGLIMFAIAGLHTCITIVFINSEQRSWLYEEPKEIITMVVKENGTHSESILLHTAELSWRGQLFFTLGAIALLLTTILGISSIPSVSASLTWREFSFIHSKLGWLTLLVSSAHDIIFGLDRIYTKTRCSGVLPSGPQYSLYIPLLCVIMKIPLLVPPVDKYLMKIRKGYERSSKNSQFQQISQV